MVNREYLKWIMPSIQNRSVLYGNDEFNFRIEKAKEQFELSLCEIDTIIVYVNEFLEKLGIKKSNKPNVKPKDRELRRFEYSNYNKTIKEDIVWIKFSKIESEKNIISVIGTGCDIYFTDFTKQNTSAGIINKSLNLEWNEDIVLIFFLENFPKELNLNRSDIESGIGNYLISKGVPILDYYSHNY